MAGRRMIDPTIWEDEYFARLSDKAKILFIACISNADDDGRLLAHPSNLRAIAFRYEDMSLKKVEELTEEISQALEHFTVYPVNGCKYIQLEKWTEYQHIRADRYKPSRIPPCQPNGNQKTTKRQPNDGIDKSRLDKSSKEKDINNMIQKQKSNSIKTDYKSKDMYREFVHLSTDEHQKLVDKFGKKKAEDWIERLNDYLGSTGKRYKSHYHTVLNWARRETDKNPPKKSAPGITAGELVKKYKEEK